MDVNDIILEFFEENDWEMNDSAVEICAQRIRTEFGSEDEAIEYIYSYMRSMFEG
jgi:hypothetical protein